MHQKLKWAEQRIGDLSTLETRRPYIIPPWGQSPRVEMEETKEKTIAKHRSEIAANHTRIYCDGSGQNNRIAAAATDGTLEKSLLLGITDDAQVFHGELIGISLGLDMLLDRIDRNSTNGTAPTETETQAVVYSDSQASLKAIKKNHISHTQSIMERILIAVDSLEKHRVNVTFKWIPGHKDIAGNEKADKTAKKATSLIGPYEKPTTRYLSAVKGILNRYLKKTWNHRWKTSIYGRATFQLIEESSKTNHILYIGYLKAYYSLLT
jgi:ribonuclease HI